ncbi:DUF418 domain-containing protein [Pseudochryseolinea flava]|uniref:DUF418 domain-containing protein n=1 Tax=Pseudochryseolinea flava TaxID=2059302 RepID=A0A364XWI3_9BACT|nr:DUF418 domain-containing protein [Pseudochryseolinea flava]RAV98729.1 hypothetical protein DQQ10_22190 [Pseudochryseolinea flava]
MNPNLITPTSLRDRITLLDALRGIAVFGILVMNIPGFSLPYAQIFDPSLKGEMRGANFYAYYIPELIFEGSQRALFSMLFGAGVLLFATRLGKKMDGLLAAEIFMRRQLWLLVFGLFNAYILLWFWDVLFHYAILGAALFAFRSCSPKVLIAAAIVCMFFSMVRENLQPFRDHQTVVKGLAIEKRDTTKVKLTPEQRDVLSDMQAIRSRSESKAKLQRVEENIESVRGSYGDLYFTHSSRSYENETGGLFYFFVWDGLLFMLLGMAFFKMGILTGEASLRTYIILCVVGLSIGITLSYWRLHPMIQHSFNYFDMVKEGYPLFYQLSRVVRALGILGLIMVLYKTSVCAWFFKLFQPVGRMAFTNYLLQSLICGFIFYGVGLGYFGKLQRYEIFYVVLGVWIFELILSHAWLRVFQYGPMEWVWRCLTYWRFHPFRKREIN